MENTTFICPGPDCPPTTSIGVCQLHRKRKRDAERAREYRLRKATKLAIIDEPVAKNAKTSTERSRECRARKVGVEQAEKLKPKNAKTSVERVRHHRKHIAEVKRAEKLKPKNAKTTVERMREYRNRKAGVPIDEIPTPLMTDEPPQYRRATREFHLKFTKNDFGHVCNVCDRLWFKDDLRPVQRSKVLSLLEQEFQGEDVSSFVACNTCILSLYDGKIPLMSRSNGFVYPAKPDHLPELDCVTERLISPRLPFLQIRRVRLDFGSKKLFGQIINVPCDVNTMVQSLPRSIDDDFAINVHIKKHQMYKTSAFVGYVKKKTVKSWLEYLLTKPLYQNISVNDTFFANGVERERSMLQLEALPVINDAGENMASQQHTMFFSEENYLSMAPGMNKRPIGLIMDEFAEELSFPGIYLGEPRTFKPGVKVSPFTMASSEIRRRDRRGVASEHVLYMAAKIMKIRMTESLYATFRGIAAQSGNITRKMIEDEEYMEKSLDSNLGFLQSIPNSVHYWARRKKDLFSMIRQLGRPTLFFTISACESTWPDLLYLLYKLKYGVPFDGDILSLKSFDRCTLVNDDPVTCCLYFDKLVQKITAILSSPINSPFGRYRVLDYFKRIEFQHRGSPHAHILLWLENDPKEPISENMPETVRLIDELISVDLQKWLHKNFVELQIHHHTFTCYKKSGTRCRFSIPFWPVNETRVLIPMSKEDSRIKNLKAKYLEMKSNLEHRKYSSLDDFLKCHNVSSYESYLNIIRAGIHRPMVMLKRNINQIMYNPMNPWVAGILKSNMDIQFILDEYSCATYIADYINKAERGMSALHRDLVKLRADFPDQDFLESMKELGSRTLNAIEMSSQEAAWFLLRLGMSESSRNVVYIPTVWPHERHRVVKSHAQMEEEELDDQSINIWRDNVFERYEKRPDVMDSVCLADFVSLYTKTKLNTYSMRKQPKIIRYRRYPMDDLINYKREMVTLYFPFRNEEADILEENKYLGIYDDNEMDILEARKRYESDINLELTIQECRRLYSEELSAQVIQLNEQRRIRIEEEQAFVETLANADMQDIRTLAMAKTAIVKKRENVLSADKYCELMRTANERQLDLIEEIIHRKWPGGNPEPIQVFLTGPAGSGKTFTMKLIMETCNRYTDTVASYNAYVATASTGMAASAIDGVTVHSAFRLSQSSSDSLSRENLNSLRLVYREVDTIFVDEVSMIGTDLLGKINSRLQQITLNPSLFGGMNIILCGDLRQLPPVRQTAIYKRSRLSLTGDMIWRSVRYYPLIQVMRQSDELLSRTLTKIGNGEKLDNEERALIESRFVRDRNSTPPDAIRLFFKTSDVDDYNKAFFSGTDAIEYTAIDEYFGAKNASQLESARNKIHKMKLDETGSLPRTLVLSVNKPYMIRSNIDVSDGLVNGAIGVLKYIERSTDNDIVRLWLKFPNTSRTGRTIRSQWLPYTRDHPYIATTWVPVKRKVAYISLRSEVRCRRTQFPVVEASAITVHKSQGGTYDKVVYDYEKRHDQQLVYVALSRATSIDGLFLTNKNNDTKFHHARGCSNQDLKKEFARLERCPLQTISDECKQFLSGVKPTELSLLTFNIQSLKKHLLDLEKRPLFLTPNIMALSETWLSNDERVEVKGYRCVTQFKREKVRAGGVAMYEKEDCMLFSTPHILMKFDKKMLDLKRSVAVSEECGDICAVESVINGQRCLLVTVYISPNSPMKDIEFFFILNLMMYTEKAGKMFEQIAERGYDKIPIILNGDFNVNLLDPKQEKFIKFMEDTFNLKLHSTTNPTTRGGSCIDAVFARNIDQLDTKNYISYFSYHRPMFTISASDRRALLLPALEE